MIFVNHETRLRIFALLVTFVTFLMPSPLKAQTNQSNAELWLSKADVAPPFSIPASRGAWEKKRKVVRAELWKLLGKLPPRPTIPKVTTLSQEDRGDYRLEKFQFDNGAGATVPGYILLPKSATTATLAAQKTKSPAILYCHWHGGEYEIGKEALFQAKHSPVEPGPEFARHGFVVLGIDAYCFGERNGRGPDGPAELGKEGEWTAAKFNLWVGRTLWGMILRDDLMALDYLASRPEVDPKRIGVTGMSMGATRTWWLMGLDERLKAGVAIACMTRYQNLIQHEMLKAHGIYYFVPGFLNHFDSEAVISLIAPRAILFQTGDQDGGSPVDGIHALEDAVRPAFEVYGKPAQFQSLVYPGLGHVYTPEMWTHTMKWFEEHLE
ncbi:MAG: dienelactone hydrolase [Verrucomicrobia bacterium]|nr:MAG: dienelactone hydrolase [Verrucomicrobiota bacterium]